MTKKHDIIWLDKIDSTNEEVLRRISCLDNLSVLSAYEQTAGRGQRGNIWSSGPNENLTFSIVLKFSDDGTGTSPLRACDQFVLNAVTSLSIREFLASHGIISDIKWPNDIYVADKKICGILIENAVKGNMLSRSIVGIGLNINQKSFDQCLPNPVSMTQCTGKSYITESLLEEFMEVFKRYCRIYLNGHTDFNDLREQYQTALWRKDIISRFIDVKSGREFTGIIRSLSEIGHIKIEDIEKGELNEFAFKDISYIL